MKTYIQSIIPQLQRFSQSLDKTAILINKPWALIDEDSEIQKLIFKKDKELILSKNGNVTMGKWDYFPEAKSLLIDRGTDKILCNEAMIDDGVLIMKLDGTNNQFFVLANENIVPDLDVVKYLIKLRRKKLKISPRALYDGREIEVMWDDYYRGYGIGSAVSIDARPIEDGKYKLVNNTYYVVKDNIIHKELIEKKYTNSDGIDIFIHQHIDYKVNEGDYVFIDGQEVENGKINFSKSKNLIVEDGVIVRFESKKSIAKRVLYVLLGIVVLLMFVAIIMYIL